MSQLAIYSTYAFIGLGVLNAGACILNIGARGWDIRPGGRADGWVAATLGWLVASGYAAIVVALAEKAV